MTNKPSPKKINVFGTLNPEKTKDFPNGQHGAFMKSEIVRASQKRTKTIRVKLPTRVRSYYLEQIKEGGKLHGQVLDFFGYFVNDGKPFQGRDGRMIQMQALYVISVKVAPSQEERTAAYEARMAKRAAEREDITNESSDDEIDAAQDVSDDGTNIYLDDEIPF